jgi:hypothetical protein
MMKKWINGNEEGKENKKKRFFKKIFLEEKEMRL